MWLIIAKRLLSIEDGVISATAFMLRPGEEYLSLNWLEYLQLLDRMSEIRTVREIYSKKLTITANARIAVLNVGVTRTQVELGSPDARIVQMLHEPIEPDDPSHSGIYNMRYDDELIAELIAESVQESYAARP
jgi:hypothetical protein